MELSHLLRRGLLVTAVAVGGWLLSAVFATGASAEELPPPEPEDTSGRPAGMLDELMAGLTDGIAGTVDGVTDAVAGIADDIMAGMADTTALTAFVPAADDSVGFDWPTVPAPPAGPSPDGGSATTDLVAAPKADVPAPRAPAPAATPAPPALPAQVSAPTAPHSPPVAQLLAAPAEQDAGNAATEHAGSGGGPAPRPVEVPSAPAGPGSTASTAHDTSGGARGTHGVPASQATLHPADAGFTARDAADDTAGRAAGLPAVSPD